MASMRAVLNDDERRITPCTSWPFASRSSARYEPSCPVMPVISARFVMRSHRVELAIPVDEAPHAFTHAGRGTEADRSFQLADVGHGRWHVARLHRQEIERRLFADALFDDQNGFEL